MHCLWTLLQRNPETPFFELKTPKEEVIRILAVFPEEGSIRGDGRASGHTKHSTKMGADATGETVRKLQNTLPEALT